MVTVCLLTVEVGKGTCGAGNDTCVLAGPKGSAMATVCLLTVEVGKVLSVDVSSALERATVCLLTVEVGKVLSVDVSSALERATVCLLTVEVGKGTCGTGNDSCVLVGAEGPAKIVGCLLTVESGSSTDSVLVDAEGSVRVTTWLLATCLGIACWLVSPVFALLSLTRKKAKTGETSQQAMPKHV